MPSASHGPSRAGFVAKAIASLCGFLAVSVACGVLASGFLLPLVPVGSTVAQSGEKLFDSLPDELDRQALSEQSNIYAADGSHLATFYIENRIVKPLAEISENMQNAVVAVEDKRFWDHKGVDVQGILRSFAQNFRSGTVSAGGSSLTQQYVKNVRIEKANSIGDQAGIEAAREESYQRKLQEAKLSIALEQRMSKEEILEGYLNIAQFGPKQYGVEAAAEYYFGVAAKDLTVVQAATIAGITKAPNALDPTPVAGDDAATQKRWTRSQERRDTVLRRMYDQAYITKAQYDEAIAIPIQDTLNITDTPVGCATANGTNSAYFCDYVVNVIKNDSAFGLTAEDRYDLLATGGLTIMTTLDPNIQAQAHQAVVDAVPVDDPSGVSMAMAVVQPGTGKILAMTQNTTFSNHSTNPRETSVNYSTDKAYGGSSGFQPGSTFKAFDLATWLSTGHSLKTMVSANRKTWGPKDWTAACMGDAKFTDPWNPGNSDGNASGMISVLDATKKSVNTAFVSLSSQLDLCDIATTAQSLGYHPADGSEMVVRPSMIIGASQDVAPLTMAAAYASFAADGVYCKPIAITEVLDRDGNAMTDLPSAECKQAISADVAHGVTYALQEVVKNTALRPDIRLADGRPSAGKTGTTNLNKHVWFVGYTPQLAAAVWAGFAEGGSEMRDIRINGTKYGYVYGRSIAAPAWQQFMNAALAGQPEIGFQDPPQDMIFGPKVTVPNVLGMTPEDAQAALTAKGLTGTIAPDQANSPYPAGTVGAQAPGSGSEVYQGTEVTLTISSGPAPVTPTVPSGAVVNPFDPSTWGNSGNSGNSGNGNGNGHGNGNGN